MDSKPQQLPDNSGVELAQGASMEGGAPAQSTVVVVSGPKREKYCGPMSWLICCCLGFPCIYFCPIDERDAPAQ